MADISDFLRTYMGLAQVVTQSRQFAQQNLLESEAQARDAIQDFQAIAAQTVDPDHRWDLARRFARPTGLTPDALIGLAPPPEAGVIRRFTEHQSLLGPERQSPVFEGREDELDVAAGQATTGLRPDQLQMSGFLGEVFGQARDQGVPAGLPREAGIRAAGVPGGNLDLLVSTAASALPQNELIQGAGVQNQTRLSAGQDASMQLGYANNRLGWAQLLERSRAMLAEGAGAGDNVGAQDLMGEIGMALRQLQEKKGQMSDMEMEIWRNWYNGLAVKARETLNINMPQLGSVEDVQNPQFLQNFNAPSNASDTIPGRPAGGTLTLPPGTTQEDLLSLLQGLNE